MGKSRLGAGVVIGLLSGSLGGCGGGGGVAFGGITPKDGWECTTADTC